MSVFRAPSPYASSRTSALQPLAASFPGTGGDDVFTGGNSAENISGKGGDDSLSGGGGSDTLAGGSGNDTLSGGAGSDKVSGGEGDDWIVGGKGDKLDGGLGYDTFLFAAATTGETLSLDLSGLPSGSLALDGATLTGFEAGELTTSDWVEIRSGAFDLTIHGSGVVRAGTGRLVADGGDRGSLFAGGSADDWLSGGRGRDSLRGGAGDDLLIVDELDNANDMVDGGVGDDTIIGGDAGDSIDGGKGRDRLEYVVSNKLNAHTITGSRLRFELDTLTVSRIEALKIELGGKNDVVKAGSLQLEAYGLRGDDSLTGGGGSDTLCGGQGDDVLDGGKGVDTASYADLGSQAPATVDLRISGAQNTGSGLDRLNSIENLIGSVFADSLTGNANANRLQGGGGADTLDGGAGKDVLVAWDGAHLTGGANLDRFVIAPPGEQTAATITILDLTANEVVDLSAVDADLSTATDDAFTFVETFSSVAGQATLTYRADEDDTVVAADTDGDGIADLQIILEGGDWTAFLGFVL